MNKLEDDGGILDGLTVAIAKNRNLDARCGWRRLVLATAMSRILCRERKASTQHNDEREQRNAEIFDGTTYGLLYPFAKLEGEGEPGGANRQRMLGLRTVRGGC